MTKKKQVPVAEKYLKKDLTTLLPAAMSGYAREVISARALPDVRDGFKPVQRRIVYTMFTSHASSRDKHMKLAKIDGLVLGSYHPHGDVSVGDATVLMSQPWRQRVKLVEIEGNNGSLDGDPAAAPRYLEARLTPQADSLMHGLNEDTVAMKPNFDNTTTEPVVLPVDWPVLFTNGTAGIAVGLATRIPQHNPVELLQAARYLNAHSDATLAQLMCYVKGPDFPTGGIVMGQSQIKKLYQHGQGSFIVRGKAEIDDNQIVITELPYGVTKSGLVSSIYNLLVKNNLDSQVDDLQDESEGLSVRIVLYLNKQADAQQMLNLLYQKSDLQYNFAANMNAIIKGRPKTFGLVDYLQAFLDFKRETMGRRFKFEYNKLSKRLELLIGFLRLQSLASQIVKMIQESEGKEDSQKKLVSQFHFTEYQAEAIVSLRLYQISHQDMLRLQTEKTKTEERLSWLIGVFDSIELFTKEVNKELTETLHLFKDVKRKTVIQDEVPVVKVDEQALITTVATTLVVKPNGVQKMSAQVFSNNQEKSPEPIIKSFATDTSHGVVLLTRHGLMMQRVIDMIPTDSVKNAVDDLHRQAVSFKADDEIIDAAIIDLNHLDDCPLMILSISKLGQAKKSYVKDSLLAFSQRGYLTRTKAYNGLKLSGDEVIWEQVVPEDDVEKVHVTIKRHSGGREVAVDFKDLSLQKATGSGTNQLKVTRDGDYIEIVE